MCQRNVSFRQHKSKLSVLPITQQYLYWSSRPRGQYMWDWWMSGQHIIWHVPCSVKLPNEGWLVNLQLVSLSAGWSDVLEIQNEKWHFSVSGWIWTGSFENPYFSGFFFVIDESDMSVHHTVVWFLFHIPLVFLWHRYK